MSHPTVDLRGSPRFVSTTRWTFDAPVSTVWTEVVERADVADWDRCVRAEPVDGWVPAVGDRIRYEVTGALPWSLRFTVEVTELASGERCHVRTSGDIVGTGRWRFEPADADRGGTVSTFTWAVDAGDPRIGVLVSLPIVRRIVRWNHSAAMDSWRRALDDRMVGSA